MQYIINYSGHLTIDYSMVVRKRPAVDLARGLIRLDLLAGLEKEYTYSCSTKYVGGASLVYHDIRAPMDDGYLPEVLLQL